MDEVVPAFGREHSLRQNKGELLQDRPQSMKRRHGAAKVLEDIDDAPQKRSRSFEKRVGERVDARGVRQAIPRDSWVLNDGGKRLRTRRCKLEKHACGDEGLEPVVARAGGVIESVSHAGELCPRRWQEQDDALDSRGRTLQVTNRAAA